MSGSHTYSCIAATQNERFGIYGVSERKECNNHISEMGKYEICIPKSRILVQRILRRHCDMFLWTPSRCAKLGIIHAFKKGENKNLIFLSPLNLIFSLKFAKLYGKESA